MEERLTVILTENFNDLAVEAIASIEKYNLNLKLCDKNGKKLIEKIKNESPDVVIMCGYLEPSYEAKDIIDTINSLLAHKPIYIVYTDFTSPMMRDEVLRRGGIYIVKPFSLKDLAERIVSLRDSGGIPTISTKAENYSPATPVNSHQLLKEITRTLCEVGVPAHIKGYHFVRDAILLSTKHPNLLHAVTKELYPEVAQKNATTSSRVERAIRHAIEVAWDRGNTSVFERYFGYTVHKGRGKPTNSEFIAMISDKLRIKYEFDQIENEDLYSTATATLMS